jgi:hypothetical protein
MKHCIFDLPYRIMREWWERQSKMFTVPSYFEDINLDSLGISLGSVVRSLMQTFRSKSLIKP